LRAIEFVDSIGRRLALPAVLIGAAALAGLGCNVTGASTSVAGSDLYRACVNCHGTAGEGDATVAAPRIAGMPGWYVAAQLTRFQNGLRGKHPDDAEGLRMRAMSQQMLSAGEITAVADYVAGLAPVTSQASLAGADAAAGQAAYVVCVACHGAKGEGNQALNAPPLAGLDDWYVDRQIRKFRSGVRGKAEGDTVGPTMQAMSLAINPSAIDDLAAYVHTLRRE
jgi:cytochrome c553